jgi:hypothetical protein
MKELPEEQKMLETLQLAQYFERSTREMCELATAIALRSERSPVPPDKIEERSMHCRVT